MPGHVCIETVDARGPRRRPDHARQRLLFHTTEERDGMLKSGMEGGVNESYAALDCAARANGIERCNVLGAGAAVTVELVRYVPSLTEGANVRRTQHPASTQHAAPSKHPAPSTQHLAPSTRDPGYTRPRSMVGERVAHYRVLSEVGHGGMGVVYLAEDEGLERRVALKFIRGRRRQERRSRRAARPRSPGRERPRPSQRRHDLRESASGRASTSSRWPGTTARRSPNDRARPRAAGRGG